MELLTTEELSARIKYDARTIRERLKDKIGSTCRPLAAKPIV